MYPGRCRPYGLAAIGLFSAFLAGCAANGPRSSKLEGPVQSDLRITRVVLYQSGVGYFERRGRIKSNLLHLRIRHDQVMDVLKSLTVVDRRSGGTVTVSLPAERSRLMQISQLPPQVRTSGGMLAIASAFRGASAVVEDDRGSHRGRIVGVENIGTQKAPDWRMTLLKGEKITSHRVAKITDMRVLDQTLTVGLSKSLDVALNKGRWKPVLLTVRLSGKAPHDLVVSYVVPMPTWKPAYRIVVGKDDQNVLLQGWSVVDNLSGESWKNARLSLTAGTPLAFKYDLYTPRDVQRPDLTPSRGQMAEAPPPAMDSTAREMPASEKARSPKPMVSRSRKSPRRSRRPLGGIMRPRRYSPKKKAQAMRDESDVSLKEMEQSYRNLVSGTAVGSLFRYDIGSPVTVPDRSSALVSIINARVKGEDILYYLVDSGKTNPYRAVRFTNSSGYVLERGPVTIYRKGTFVGEALGGRVEKGASAFVPYALEGRAIVHLRSHTKDEGLKLIKIRNGHLTVETRSVTRFTYKITDRTGERLSLYVGRRRRDGWKVVEPKNVIMEKTLYYTKIPLKPSGKTTFTVKEVTPVRRTLSIYDDRARKALALYLKGAEASGPLREQLRKVTELWDELSKVEDRMSTIKSSINMLRSRLADIRDNVKVLGKRGNRDLRRKLLQSMTKVEKQLDELNREWVVNNMKRGELRQRLRVLIKMVRL